MIIQWFPGHMTKALRMMEVEVKLADLIFYVLDARAPLSCLNVKLHEVAGNKPFIYVLSKADLADDAKTKYYKTYFEKQGHLCITVNSMVSNSAKQIVKLAQEALKEKLQRFAAKGIAKPLRAMVVGVPNSGKSSLINNLAGRAAALAKNTPGVTRGKQWVRISDKMELLDTPGTLWPSFEDQEIAKNLAFIGSISDDVLDIFGLAQDFIQKLTDIDANVLKTRYKLNDLALAPLDILGQIAKARGFIKSGAELDLERAAIAVLDDFRKGRLGKITLE